MGVAVHDIWEVGMKDVGLAAVYYQRMREDLLKVRAECDETPTPRLIMKEGAYEDKLCAFRLGLECAGILEEVEEEWRKRYGNV